jgi:hypothetical protein
MRLCASSFLEYTPTVSYEGTRGSLQCVNGDHDETPTNCVENPPCGGIRLAHGHDAMNLIKAIGADAC